MTEFAQRIFADLESRQREDRRDEAVKNLDYIEAALRYLWDEFTPDMAASMRDEELHDFLMQTEDELSRFFVEVREAIRD